MAFARPLFLILLLALPYVVLLGRPAGRHGRGRIWAALVLRCTIVLLVVLSLAGAQTVHGGDELAVVFLVDVSDSVPPAGQERALAFVEEALATLGPTDRAAVVLFGGDALVERPMTGGGELGEVASIPQTQQTDLEGAVRLGMALFPAGAARRMVILSDGRPTLGEAEQAVRLANAQGIQVSVVPLEAPLGEEAWLSDLAAPGQLRQGEAFSLSITARATDDADGVLTVLMDQQVVAQQQVHLNPGTNTFAVSLTAGAPGFVVFRAYLDPVPDTYSQNNALSAFALVEGPPQVLVVAAQDEGASLVTALEAAGMVVSEAAPGGLPADPAGLAQYGSVVLVDTPARALSPQAMEALRVYVRDLGGGLVAVGGPQAYGVGGWYETPLEQALPVEMTIDDPQRFPPMSIVVVIDKSGSMAAQEGGVQKIHLAGEAAARVAELIMDMDEITVIAFDDRPVDVIGPLPGTRRDEVIAQVVRLRAGGGGIYVRESLQAALDVLGDTERPVRHIVLLADGADAEHQGGVRELVEEEIAAQGITLSTVAIGEGQDLAFLEEIAALGGGRYHFTDRAANLPVIFAQETQLAMRSYVIEEPFYPRQVASSPMLAGVEAVPQLAGYVATTPKPAGRVILETDKNDPLLAAWQYGLGRAVAWTSDAAGRWAQQWVGWDGFPRFWSQIVRWTVVQRADVPVEMSVSLAGQEAHVTVDAVDEEGQFVDGLEAAVSVVGPGGAQSTVALDQTAPGRYEGTFVPQAEGAYLMRLSGALEGEEVVALTGGWVMSYSPEYAALESDPDYLARLAELGGGAVLDEPVEALVHELRGAGARRDLAPLLLGLAALLLPLDVAVRRLALSRRDLGQAWVWVVERVPPGRRRPEAVGPSPVGPLLRAKSRAQRRRREEGLPPAAEPERAPPAEPRSAPASWPGKPPTEEEADAGTLAERLLREKRRREEED